LFEREFSIPSLYRYARFLSSVSAFTSLFMNGATVRDALARWDALTLELPTAVFGMEIQHPDLEPPPLARSGHRRANATTSIPQPSRASELTPPPHLGHMRTAKTPPSIGGITPMTQRCSSPAREAAAQARPIRLRGSALVSRPRTRLPGPRSSL
jgi:hypothetical protein